MRSFGGSWSESKLQCVEDYARAYLRVLQNQPFELHYVDAFSGSGRQKVKSTGTESADPVSLFDLLGEPEETASLNEFLEGSALRALRVSATSTRGFDKHVFIDLSRKSCGDLSARVLNEYPALVPRTTCICADANQYLLKYASEQNWRRVRSLVFLDPFDTSVEWSTIEALAGTRACDVWYLFPLGIGRMMPHSGDIPPAWATRLDLLLGTHSWRDVFYQSSVQESLFGPEEVTVRSATEEQLVAYVIRRLRSVFAGVSKPAILRNSRNAPLFALVMGISNTSPNALKRAKDIANYLVKGLNGES
jgi:three-Cys-motif partner protein